MIYLKFVSFLMSAMFFALNFVLFWAASFGSSESLTCDKAKNPKTRGDVIANTLLPGVRYGCQVGSWLEGPAGDK